MTLIEEIAQHLHNQNVGQLATSLFFSYLPDTDTGTFSITVLDTGGMSPDPDLPTKEPTFQIFLTAATYEIGKAKLDTIRATLHQQKNIQLIPGGTYFYFILANAEGGHLGRNENGRDEFSINFHARTR